MSNRFIPLGYEVGSGAEVSVPAAHTAVVGITQQSGKTTTLESLAHRSERAVIAFVTKRGEGAFSSAPGHEVAALSPYFRERADWQFVEAVLEATMRERMKYERQWIMRVSRAAKTLQDVRLNTRVELDKARGDFMKGTYEKLLAYLDIVVPQLNRIKWAPGLQPRRCLNVMNLTEMTSEVQALVIASTLDYVMEHLKDVIVIMPEAWEFIPRGRKSPVTLSAEAYVRKGAALKNFLWIDSQDITGVHTPILKQTTVWLLGVQREINEVKRTLAMVPPVPNKIKPEAITHLGLGQFYAVYAGHSVKTYVQPWWASETDARLAAKHGDEHARVAAELKPRTRESHTPDYLLPLPPTPTKGVITDIEDPLDAELREENARLKRDLEILQETNVQLRQRLEQLLDQRATPNEATDLARESVRPGPRDTLPASSPLNDLDYWPLLKSRILADADVIKAVAKIHASTPEIIVEVTPRKVSIDGATSRGRIARLIANGFFDSAKRQGECRSELQRTGTDVTGGQVSTLLAEFVRDGFLTRHGNDRYIKAEALKVSVRELQAV